MIMAILLITFLEGRKHDAGMLRDSHMLNELQLHAYSPASQVICVYGDPTYPLRSHLQARAGARGLTPAMQLHDKNMSKVRTSVQWIFEDVAHSFKFLDYKNNLKTGLRTTGKIYVACAIICNTLTFMYGNKTSAFFALEPPLVHEYFP